MDQDAAWTRLFGQPVFAQDLLRLAMPGLVRWLDFSTLEEVSTRWAMAKADDAPRLQTVGGYTPRTGDRAWRVGYGDDSGRSVLMPTEFQSDTDADMDLRSREYGLLGYQAAKRSQPDRDGSVRLVPVVIYSGGPKWAASYPGWAQPRANVTATGEPWLARTSRHPSTADDDALAVAVRTRSSRLTIGRSYAFAVFLSVRPATAAPRRPRYEAWREVRAQGADVVRFA
ncbi:MAG: hypothetical protein F4Y26_17385 [Gammaproteobacteria bacterium]|nr:hypothetical protein [Gammaproteobacteria bacterium]